MHFLTGLFRSPTTFWYGQSNVLSTKSTLMNFFQAQETFVEPLGTVKTVHKSWWRLKKVYRYSIPKHYEQKHPDISVPSGLVVSEAKKKLVKNKNFKLNLAMNVAELNRLQYQMNNLRSSLQTSSGMRRSTHGNLLRQVYGLNQAAWKWNVSLDKKLLSEW